MISYISWKDIITKINNVLQLSYGPASQDPASYLSRGGFPYSISEAEFNFVKDQIIIHNFTSGFDFATGIGISALAMGIGLKETSGHIHSIDCYAEEVEQNLCSRLNYHEVANGGNNQYILNKKIIELFNLQNIVTLHNGWSPQDCIPIMNSVEYIDIVFLDGPKTDVSFIETLDYLKPKLAKTYMILVHDTHCFRNDFITLSKSILNINPIFKQEYPEYNGLTTPQPLGIITNADNININW